MRPRRRCRRQTPTRTARPVYRHAHTRSRRRTHTHAHARTLARASVQPHTLARSRAHSHGIAHVRTHCCELDCALLPTEPMAHREEIAHAVGRPDVRPRDILRRRHLSDRKIAAGEVDRKRAPMRRKCSVCGLGFAHQPRVDGQRPRGTPQPRRAQRRRRVDDEHAERERRKRTRRRRRAVVGAQRAVVGTQRGGGAGWRRRGEIRGDVSVGALDGGDEVGGVVAAADRPSRPYRRTGTEAFHRVAATACRTYKYDEERPSDRILTFAYRCETARQRYGRAGGRSASRPLPHAPSSIAHIASGTASAPVPTGVAVGDADRSLSSTHAPAAPVGVSVGVGVCGPIPHCTGAAVAPPSAAAALSAAALSGLPQAQQLASAASRERGRREQQWPSAMAVGNGRRKRPSATAVGNRARQRGRPG
jgi:hypothetical protein